MVDTSEFFDDFVDFELADSNSVFVGGRGTFAAD